MLKKSMVGEGHKCRSNPVLICSDVMSESGRGDRTGAEVWELRRMRLLERDRRTSGGRDEEGGMERWIMDE